MMTPAPGIVRVPCGLSGELHVMGPLRRNQVWVNRTPDGYPVRFPSLADHIASKGCDAIEAAMIPTMSGPTQGVQTSRLSGWNYVAYYKNARSDSFCEFIGVLSTHPSEFDLRMRASRTPVTHAMVAEKYRFYGVGRQMFAAWQYLLQRMSPVGIVSHQARTDAIFVTQHDERGDQESRRYWNFCLNPTMAWWCSLGFMPSHVGVNTMNMTLEFTQDVAVKFMSHKQLIKAFHEGQAGQNNMGRGLPVPRRTPAEIRYVIECMDFLLNVYQPRVSQPNNPETDLLFPEVRRCPSGQVMYYDARFPMQYTDYPGSTETVPDVELRPICVPGMILRAPADSDDDDDEYSMPSVKANKGCAKSNSDSNINNNDVSNENENDDVLTGRPRKGLGRCCLRQCMMRCCCVGRSISRKKQQTRGMSKRPSRSPSQSRRKSRGSSRRLRQNNEENNNVEYEENEGYEENEEEVNNEEEATENNANNEWNNSNNNSNANANANNNSNANANANVNNNSSNANANANVNNNSSNANANTNNSSNANANSNWNSNTNNNMDNVVLAPKPPRTPNVKHYDGKHPQNKCPPGCRPRQTYASDVTATSSPLTAKSSPLESQVAKPRQKTATERGSKQIMTDMQGHAFMIGQKDLVFDDKSTVIVMNDHGRKHVGTMETQGIIHKKFLIS